MMTIHLHKLRFHAFHGIYAEEKVLGGEFEVNLSVKYTPASLPVTDLHHTVNYAVLYDLVKKEMEQPCPILETFVTKLASDVLAQFSIVEEVEISILKLRPPVISFEGSVGVSFTLKRAKE